MAGRVLIYGGTGGIGSATARLLHERGYDLHLVARDEGRLAALAKELGASYTVGDVRDTDLFARVAAEAGDVLHGLVYAVGTVRLRSLKRLSREDFHEDLQLNAVGAALAVQTALPALRNAEGRASVVLFSSVAARQGFALHASTSMSKGAVIGLMLALAAELAPSVRVNAIAPSLTRTPLTAGLVRNEEAASGLAALHPLGRLGEAVDVAALVAFLISGQSSWITGQEFGVDGGRSTLRPRG